MCTYYGMNHIYIVCIALLPIKKQKTMQAGSMRTRLATTILACIFALNWFYYRYAYLDSTM